jgi:hypothetical protein
LRKRCKSSQRESSRTLSLSHTHTHSLSLSENFWRKKQKKDRTITCVRVVVIPSVALHQEKKHNKGCV